MDASNGSSGHGSLITVPRSPERWLPATRGGKRDSGWTNERRTSPHLLTTSSEKELDGIYTAPKI